MTQLNAAESGPAFQGWLQAEPVLTMPCTRPIETQWGSQVSGPAGLQVGTGPTSPTSGVSPLSPRSSDNAGCPLAQSQELLNPSWGWVW